MNIEINYKKLEGHITTEGDAYFLLEDRSTGFKIKVNIPYVYRNKLLGEVQEFANQKL